MPGTHSKERFFSSHMYRDRPRVRKDRNFLRGKQRGNRRNRGRRALLPAESLVLFSYYSQQNKDPATSKKKSNGTASSQISPRGYPPRHLIIAIDHAISLSLNQLLKGRQKNKNVESKLELPCINASGNAKKEEMQSKPELPCINQSWNAE